MRSFLLCLHSELLPALICEGFIDAFTRHFSERLWTSVFVSACKANPLLRQYSFHWCVISLFCLCLQGWPMNRQLRKGPQIFHRSVSESRASLPRAGVTPSPALPSYPSWAGACTLLPLFILQYSVKRRCLTVFGTVASRLSSFIFGLVRFLFFCCLFSTSLRNQKWCIWSIKNNTDLE